ncbi:hypothetical protein M9H77_27924 [Catharanthus roseus]|uniref:Uncharacterized protein n=1 Tax=Catharanthus roseus TaxID=4058 RepID=A0ACC0AI14_CATRO|nr:hypothetical protein M9H77_27924 [Catharanthus roseus]
MSRQTVGRFERKILDRGGGRAVRERGIGSSRGAGTTHHGVGPMRMGEKGSRALHTAGFIAFYTDGSTESRTVGSIDSSAAGTPIQTQVPATQTQVPDSSTSPDSSSASTIQPSLSMALSTDPTAWKPPPGNTRQLLTLNVNRYLARVVHGPYHVGLRSHRLSVTCGGKSFRCVWDSSLSMTNMRHAWEVKQEDLTEKFSKSRHLEELHKHQSRDKKGQYVDFHSEKFWKAEEEAAATGIPLLDDLQLMAGVFGGLDRSRFY